MAYYMGGNTPLYDSTQKFFDKYEYKDPFPNGVSRKYWDFQYYLEKPKSQSQMNDQMTVSGLPLMGWLKDYHVAKESEEKTQYTMDLYDIKFSDVKYPYLTALGSSSYAGSRAFSAAAVTVSKNITRLYR